MKKTLFLTLLIAAAVLPIQAQTAGKCGGRFSVSPNCKVRFAEGNLQYQPSTGRYRFAPEQTLVCGWNPEYTDSRYTGYIDLFGWGTGAAPTQYSEEAADYAFADWGAMCGLPTGDGKQWRTLSDDEWSHLLKKRPNARRLYALAYVERQFGLVLLPDDWKKPQGIWIQTGIPDTIKNYWSAKTWSRIEAAGAVFLPCEVKRSGTRSDGGRAGCHYWTSTPDPKKPAEAWYILADIYGPRGRAASKASGFSVRLVQE